MLCFWCLKLMSSVQAGQFRSISEMHSYIVGLFLGNFHSNYHPGSHRISNVNHMPALVPSELLCNLLCLVLPISKCVSHKIISCCAVFWRQSWESWGNYFNWPSCIFTSTETTQLHRCSFLRLEKNRSGNLSLFFLLEEMTSSGIWLYLCGLALKNSLFTITRGCLNKMRAHL